MSSTATAYECHQPRHGPQSHDLYSACQESRCMGAELAVHSMMRALPARLQGLLKDNKSDGRACLFLPPCVSAWPPVFPSLAGGRESGEERERRTRDSLRMILVNDNPYMYRCTMSIMPPLVPTYALQSVLLYNPYYIFLQMNKTKLRLAMV